MVRPTSSRKICPPLYSYFGPVSQPGARKEEIILTLDELEAVPPADRETLYQDEAAEKMGASRQSSGSIIETARKKIAGAILTGRKRSGLKEGRWTYAEGECTFVTTVISGPSISEGKRYVLSAGATMCKNEKGN